jgi:hypothetical protein
MKDKNSWQEYLDLSDNKAQRREKKKRKRMPVSGKEVFKILRLKKGV